MVLSIYTDGSCHPQLKIGAWACIIVGKKGTEVLLKAVEEQSTNNQMELVAAIRAIQYIQESYPNNINLELYTDSQYLMRLPQRAKKLQENDFLSGKGKPIPNQSLVKTFLALYAISNINLIKLKAHGRKEQANPYHRRVDLLSRKLLRKAVQDINEKE